MVSIVATLIMDMSLFYESDVTTRSLYRFDLRVRAPRPTLPTLKTPGTMTVRLLKQTGREATKRHFTFELDSLTRRPRRGRAAQVHRRIRRRRYRGFAPISINSPDTLLVERRMSPSGRPFGLAKGCYSQGLGDLP